MAVYCHTKTLAQLSRRLGTNALVGQMLWWVEETYGHLVLAKDPSYIHSPGKLLNTSWVVTSCF